MSVLAWLWDVLGEMALVVALLAALFVPLERVFTGRRQGHQRPGLGLDVVYVVFQYVVMASVLAGFNNGLQRAVGPLSSENMFRALPVVVQVVLVVVAGDVLLYWAHRVCHVVPVLWRFHAVHHSATHLDWVAAHREHPLDGLYSQLWLNLPAFVLGVDVAVVAPWFVVRGLCAIFVHSNVRADLGVFGLLLGDPVLHRWHHARVDVCRHNFANVAPYLDVLFGTHHRPAHEDYPLGMEAPGQRGLRFQLLGHAPTLDGPSPTRTRRRQSGPAPAPSH